MTMAVRAIQRLNEGGTEFLPMTRTAPKAKATMIKMRVSLESIDNYTPLKAAMISRHSSSLSLYSSLGKRLLAQCISAGRLRNVCVSSPH